MKRRAVFWTPRPPLNRESVTLQDGAGAPGVAIVDVGLPQLDGYDVARALRSALGRAVVLIAVTGYGRLEDRRRAVEAGFDAHVTKPAAVGDILRAIPDASR